jgi:hypothetical protein
MEECRRDLTKNAPIYEQTESGLRKLEDDRKERERSTMLVLTSLENVCHRGMLPILVDGGK